MHVIVLGAGVVGVTTAYYLARRGYRVTIVEKADGAAEGASFANGGQLSYSFTDALAQPSMLARLPGILSGNDPAVRIGRVLDPSLLRWAAAFLVQCTRHRATANTLHALALALRSRDLLEELCSQVPVDFGFRKAGKLVLSRKPATLRAAARMLRDKRARGCDIDVLNWSDAAAVEPAVIEMDERFCGAIHGAADELGDTRLFARQLAAWLVRNTDTVTRFATEATKLDIGTDGFRCVHTTNDVINGDALVMCPGACSPRLAASGGFRARIAPVRGYSLTLPRGFAAPACSITDADEKILFSPLGSLVRVTGFVDFVGSSTRRDATRLRTLKDTAMATAPGAAEYDAAFDDGWGGFRPVTPDGRPVVGATSVPGIFTNMGHGFLGWTLACATAFDAAAAVERWRRETTRRKEVRCLRFARQLPDSQS